MVELKIKGTAVYRVYKWTNMDRRFHKRFVQIQQTQKQAHNLLGSVRAL